MASFFLLVVSALTSFVSAGLLAPRQNTTLVNITALEKNVTPRSGSGAVSAAGTLSPFGEVGLGCGINWQETQSVGGDWVPGGLQAGSDTFGMGSGLTITPDAMNVGLGISVIPADFNSTVSVAAAANGTITLVFASTGNFSCEDTTVDGMKAMKCTSK
ncbi:uncharacterized protein BCR38DRAFT_492563 [Pseudomassariella vexata]|uniref:Uncharacterized protein n=1 Tax=Pseudomassariella vexata TaxID=1141098 RepID=A0A1Y2EJH9_9PEZI|nr:uncharacterized protein BCR38DRAFT_492563 [Pseudomassariella vexata]ORY71416.1 hypothetical protein BCR38DRAFT_492563 [Pseudomassariella vexata]